MDTQNNAREHAILTDSNSLYTLKDAIELLGTHLNTLVNKVQTLETRIHTLEQAHTDNISALETGANNSQRIDALQVTIDTLVAHVERQSNWRACCLFFKLFNNL